jgi:y4mF family transcriptional regulator
MNKKKLGQLLKKRRNELGINQIDLSEISGVALHTISDIESGKGNPTLQVINKICDILGMELMIRVIGQDE